MQVMTSRLSHRIASHLTSCHLYPLQPTAGYFRVAPAGTEVVADAECATKRNKHTGLVVASHKPAARHRCAATKACVDAFCTGNDERGQPPPAACAAPRPGEIAIVYRLDI
jgi:hypothetical protein